MLNTLVITNTNGNAPAKTIAISPTIAIPSCIGAIPGIITIPVNASTIAAARPNVITITTPFPKYVNPFIIAFSNFNNPSAITIANIIIGIKFLTTIISGNPATNPPTNAPTGIVIIPASIPVAKNF
ncbi:hypothetical protein SDC9_117391 [bioreactor metagenome]|uniref:Uncharacterized protein n=1 Tax=bioreactor metagenome TaxID=1076179 RepID=A0A645BY45_9ZZZZ